MNQKVNPAVVIDLIYGCTGRNATPEEYAKILSLLDSDKDVFDLTEEIIGQTRGVIGRGVRMSDEEAVQRIFSAFLTIRNLVRINPKSLIGKTAKYMRKVGMHSEEDIEHMKLFMEESRG